jgi:hypothetical protein
MGLIHGCSLQGYDGRGGSIMDDGSVVPTDLVIAELDGGGGGIVVVCVSSSLSSNAFVENNNDDCVM